MSGKVLVRMPPALHEQLVQLAKEQGVSLNQFVVALLAGGVCFKKRAGGGCDAPAPTPGG